VPTKAFCCFSCCCYRDQPQATKPRCHHCCHCLIRGSSGGAGVAACGGGSGSSSSGGSGGGSEGGGGGSGSGAFSSSSMFSSSSSLLVLLVGIILPLFVAHCSFHRLPLASLQCAMVGRCLHLSTALFVIACRPAIINDCVAGRRPLAAGASRRSCVAGGRRLCRSSDAVVLVLVVVVAGGGVGLLVGTKPWWRTSWSSSVSGRCRHLGSKAR